MAKKVVLLGFGSLGTYIFKAISSSENLSVIGIVDNDPRKIGKKVGDKSDDSCFTIKESISKITQKPNVVVQATTSRLQEAYEQINDVTHFGADIVSTCEQLVYPHVVDSKIADKIDKLAKKNAIRIVGVGINPGFIMDSFPIYASSLCSKIHKISITRSIDLSKRRKALQEKMGVGMTRSQFRKKKENLGHYGLLQSAMMICQKLCKDNVQSKMSIRPVLTNNSEQRSYGDKKASVAKVIGIKHLISCRQKNAQEFLSMNLTMALGAKEYDLLEINGTPPVRIRTDGLNGDLATAGLIKNYIHALESKSPGLYTVTELGLTGYKE